MSRLTVLKSLECANFPKNFSLLFSFTNNNNHNNNNINNDNDNKSLPRLSRATCRSRDQLVCGPPLEPASRHSDLRLLPLRPALAAAPSTPSPAATTTCCRSCARSGSCLRSEAADAEQPNHSALRFLEQTRRLVSSSHKRATLVLPSSDRCSRKRACRLRRGRRRLRRTSRRRRWRRTNDAGTKRREKPTRPDRRMAALVQHSSRFNNLLPLPLRALFLRSQPLIFQIHLGELHSLDCLAQQVAAVAADPLQSPNSSFAGR